MTDDGRAGIDAALVRRLIATQFPRWAGLPVTPVAVDGWDNRTYRLGPDLTVRLPTGPGYVAGVEKENRWLPRLAPQLPLPIPRVEAVGRPGAGYPYPWSVRRWLTGETARTDRIADPVGFATDLAGFLRALWACDPTGGPAAGEHSWWRGASLGHYDAETRRCLTVLADRVDRTAALAAWEAALGAERDGPPRWFHGDIATGNLLVRDGRLAAVIDFGTCGVGDPACDLVISWTFLDGPGRDAFAAAVDPEVDGPTWARARGWALWKALLVLSEVIREDPARADEQRRVIDAVLSS